VEPLGFVEKLAAARIGETFNQYADSEVRRDRLRAHLAARADAETILVGEAAGYRGARVSGLAFTSERQLTGTGPAEATATIVHRVLATHPGTASSNRRPTRAEVDDARPFLRDLSHGRRAVAVGRLAAEVLDAPYVRHPSHGGAAPFAQGLRAYFATIPPRRATRAAFP
jgi:uracil-DNA glycosylase